MNELDRAKRFLIGRFPQRASGLAGMATLQTVAWMHELPDDEWSTEQARTAAVDVGRVQRLAGRCSSRRGPWVAVGPSDQLDAIGRAQHRGSLLKSVRRTSSSTSGSDRPAGLGLRGHCVHPVLHMRPQF